MHRVDLLRAAVAARKKHTLATLTGAMNKAATQDLRVVRVWPIVKAVLQTGSAPSARAEAAASLLDNWRLSGSSRLDRDLDGSVDDPGAAVMDAAWPRIADAVMAPVLGPLVGRLALLHGRSDDAGPGGSSYISGWYGYVDKDLRTLLGREVRGPYSRRYCGAGVLATCRDALWGGDRRRGRPARGDAGSGSVVVASGCRRGADPVRVGRAPGHDALVQSPDLPAADVVLVPSPQVATLAA